MVSRSDLTELEEQAQAKLRGLVIQKGELEAEYSDLQERIRQTDEQTTRAKRTVAALNYLLGTLDFSDEG